MADALHADPAGLVRRCLAGDDAARAEFIATYDSLIRRAVARRIQRTASARANAAHLDDIANEVYLRLFADNCRALASLQQAKSLSAWLVTVSQNQAITFLRKIGATHSARDEESMKDQPAPYEHAPDQRAMSKELSDRVADGLARLDDRDRLVLQLFYLYNQRYADIAETLHMNINTVASRLLRAKQKLKDAMEEKQP